MAIEYPQPIRRSFESSFTKMQQASAGLSKRATMMSETLSSRDMINLLAERDAALLAAMTAIDKMLEYLDAVKPADPPGTVHRITIAPV